MTLPATVLSTLWSDSSVELGYLHGKRGQRYHLTLDPTRYCYKEGELSFTLTGIADGFNVEGCAAESMEMTASQPLKNLRHEAFAQRIAAGTSATAAYADAYERERESSNSIASDEIQTILPTWLILLTQVRLYVGAAWLPCFAGLPSVH